MADLCRKTRVIALALWAQDEAMIFYFQVRTGSHVFHTDTANLGTLEDARREASRRAGELLVNHALRLWIDEEWQLDVTDERGLILFVIYISATKSSATNAK